MSDIEKHFPENYFQKTKKATDAKVSRQAVSDLPVDIALIFVTTITTGGCAHFSSKCNFLCMACERD